MAMALPSHDALIERARHLLDELGVGSAALESGSAHGAVGCLPALTPITGRPLGTVAAAGPEEVTAAVSRAVAAFESWREVPPPERGVSVRTLGELLRANKAALGELVSLEAGKIRTEGLGEVQEMIDICEFAVGLSRQLYGLTIASERGGHRMMETWHPLGVCGVITAFNFPVAVWAWNAALALVCGDAVVWKPSERTPLTALACAALARRAACAVGAPEDLVQVINGGRAAGEALVDNHSVGLVSATGSTAMGRSVGPRVSARFGRVLLELGGNNGAIVAPSADLDLTVRAVVFSAAGTAGQRCTSLRRLIVHRTIADDLIDRLAAAYRTLPIGDPLDDGTLVGPLISAQAGAAMQAALATVESVGGSLVVGGERLFEDEAPEAWYARPAIVRTPSQPEIVCTETFAPILYAMTYDDLDQAIDLHNAVPQGLASSIFTLDLREAERFMSASGSDCGIANVNIGPSGAEIGGAFGGEKETGGGRESGSDSWKTYMRRATNTINWSTDLPLAQGVTFS